MRNLGVQKHFQHLNFILMKTLKTVTKAVALLIPMALMTWSCELQEEELQEIELQVESTEGTDIGDREHDNAWD